MGVTARGSSGGHVSGLSAAARIVRESSVAVGQRAVDSSADSGSLDLLLGHFVAAVGD